MDLTHYGLEECLQAAIKSEHDAAELYDAMAESVDNVLLSDRLSFLADEERKHERLMRAIFGQHFPDLDLVMPAVCPIPLPEVVMTPTTTLVDIVAMAMAGEAAAHLFYEAMAAKLEAMPGADARVLMMVRYIAKMELGHYRILELEKDTLEEYEHIETLLPDFDLFDD